MVAAVVAVGLGEDDPVATDMVDGADMLLVRSDDSHMLANLAEQLALALASGPPIAEIALEPALVLTAIIVIVAIELVQLALPPFAVVRVMEAGCGPAEVTRAFRCPPVLRPVAIGAEAAILVLAEAAAAEEAAGVGPAIAFIAEPRLAIVARTIIVTAETPLAAPAFVIAEPPHILAAAALCVLVTEPAGDLVACAFEKAAVPVVIVAVPAARGAAAFAIIASETGARLAPASAALVTVISHGNSSLFEPA